jgi:imipenem/basic amino acid-specific outer membrane pore
MKKTVALSMMAACVTGMHAADDLAGMFSEGKTSGQIRMFYIDRDYSGYEGAPHRNATALGGNLKFETAELSGVSAGASAYTTNRIFQGLEYGPSSEGEVDPSLFGYGYKSYSIFGEAYVNLHIGSSNLRVGRQKLNTPMAGADDARELPNFFEAYVYTNTGIENTTLVAAQVSKFAPGTFANIYAGGGILAATSGYSPVAANYPKYSGDFANMGTWAVGEQTDGVSTLAAVYNKGPLMLQAWDYYAWDILNALYVEGKLGWDCRLNKAVKLYVAAQAIKENNVGDDYLKNLGGNGEIDSLYWAFKAGGAYHGFSAYAAYSQTSKNSDGDPAYANALISPWGGMPAYTQGMVTRHQFMAGTKAWKAAATYSFKEQGVALAVTGYYTSFDMDKNNGYSAAYSWTATEPGFDIQYYPAAVKNLQLRLRGNFPDKFYESDVKTVSWNEYRFIVNYNF